MLFSRLAIEGERERDEQQNKVELYWFSSSSRRDAKEGESTSSPILLQKRRHHRDETQFFTLKCAQSSNLFQLSILSRKLFVEEGWWERSEDLALSQLQRRVRASASLKFNKTRRLKVSSNLICSVPKLKLHQRNIWVCWFHWAFISAFSHRFSNDAADKLCSSYFLDSNFHQHRKSLRENSFTRKLVLHRSFERRGILMRKFQFASSIIQLKCFLSPGLHGWWLI